MLRAFQPEADTPLFRKLFDIRHRRSARCNAVNPRPGAGTTTASAAGTTLPPASICSIATGTVDVTAVAALAAVAPVVPSAAVTRIATTSRTAIARRDVSIHLAVAVALDAVSGRALLPTSGDRHFSRTAEAGELLLLQGDRRGWPIATITSTATASAAVKATTLTTIRARPALSWHTTTTRLTATATLRCPRVGRQARPHGFMLSR